MLRIRPRVRLRYVFHAIVAAIGLAGVARGVWLSRAMGVTTPMGLALSGGCLLALGLFGACLASLASALGDEPNGVGRLLLFSHDRLKRLNKAPEFLP